MSKKKRVERISVEPPALIKGTPSLVELRKFAIDLIHVIDCHAGMPIMACTESIIGNHCAVLHEGAKEIQKERENCAQDKLAPHWEETELTNMHTYSVPDGVLIAFRAGDKPMDKDTLRKMLKQGSKADYVW